MREKSEIKDQKMKKLTRSFLSRSMNVFVEKLSESFWQFGKKIWDAKKNCKIYIKEQQLQELKDSWLLVYH